MAGRQEVEHRMVGCRAGSRGFLQSRRLGARARTSRCSSRDVRLIQSRPVSMIQSGSHSRHRLELLEAASRRDAHSGRDYGTIQKNALALLISCRHLVAHGTTWLPRTNPSVSSRWRGNFAVAGFRRLRWHAPGHRCSKPIAGMSKKAHMCCRCGLVGICDNSCARAAKGASFCHPNYFLRKALCRGLSRIDARRDNIGP
jgi:hypothetical protein